jgi:hypothetical protein
VVALALNELAWCFPRLTFQFSLLLTNPDQLGDRIGTRYFKACVGWGSKGHTSIRRMNGEMDILDVLPGHRYRNLA